MQPSRASTMGPYASVHFALGNVSKIAASGPVSSHARWLLVSCDCLELLQHVACPRLDWRQAKTSTCLRARPLSSSLSLTGAALTASGSAWWLLQLGRTAILCKGLQQLPQTCQLAWWEAERLASVSDSRVNVCPALRRRCLPPQQMAPQTSCYCGDEA